MKPKNGARLAGLRRQRQHFRNWRPGAVPGSLEGGPAAVAPDTAPASIGLLRYGAQGLLAEQRPIALADCQTPAPQATEVTWLHLQGQPTSEQLKALGQAFGLHPLALEDVLHREARAKLESFEAQQFVVLNHVHRGSDDGFCADPVTFFLGRNYVISVNQGPQDIFEPVRERIRSATRICAHGADYLLYALLDLVVDTAFTLLEELGDRLEQLEDQILDEPDRNSRNQIHYAKRELVLMRRAWWPQREVIAALMRDEERLLSDTTRLYLRDCHDHAVIVVDFVETYREMASSLLDTYLSAMNQRMNDIMKVLTIIATIFMPLSFIAGLYGMNFDTASPWNLPELHWHYGYLYALGLMGAVVVGMLAYFKRKRWW